MGQRFDNLQALRGAACLLVVVYHAAGWEVHTGADRTLLGPARWFGYAGVDLFFVLSGFIIASTSRADLGCPSRLPGYLFRRAWRIYPTYWAALAVAVGLTAAGGSPLLRPGWRTELVDTVLLLPQAYPRFLVVAWTLSYELMFYLAFGVLFLLPKRAAVPGLLVWAAVVAGSALSGREPGNRFAALAVSPYVLEFLAGALLGWAPVRLSGRAAAGLVGLAAAWCGAGSLVRYDPDPLRLVNDPAARAVVFGMPAALVVFALTGWERAGGRLGRRWLARVGDASYSVYLVHLPGLGVAWTLTHSAGWGHGPVSHLAWVGVMLAAGVLPGLLFYRFVERPLLRLAKRTRPAAAPPAAERVRKAA